MSTAAIVVCLGALALIGLLPRVFFRRGRLNARWWLTASPFALSGGTLLLGLFGRVTPLVDAAVLDVVALGLAGAGVALIRWTLATHARPVSLWHQENDRPDELVTRGAYARVRHPFYASFLLVLIACAAALPHALTIGALAAAFLLLDRTAAREERRLTREFGARYVGYARRTGRFLPIRAGIVVLCLLMSAPGAAQVGTPVSGEKLRNPEFGREQSLGADVQVGASMGLMAGGLVAAAMCAWDEFVTVGLSSEDDDDDYMCDLGAPLLSIAVGTAAGTLLGLVVGAFGGDMPRGSFTEWRTGDPHAMPADPKRSKVDDAEWKESLSESQRDDMEEDDEW